MSGATPLARAEQQLRIFEAAAAAIERGRFYVLDGAEVGPADLLRIVVLRDEWRRECVRLARAPVPEDGTRRGRAVTGIGRRLG